MPCAPVANAQARKSRRTAFGVVCAIALVSVFAIWWTSMHQSALPLLVTDGEVYHLFSYDLNPGENGQELYLVTFGYQVDYEKAEADGTLSAVRRGTILVPKSCCVFDNSLPLRSVSWESSTIEGKVYRIVRMHPLHRVSSDGGVIVKEEAPLRQQK